MSGFEIERSPDPRFSYMAPRADYRDQSEVLYQETMANFNFARTRAFAVSGNIPYDAADLTIFFRSTTGITHSLDFPIDVEIDTPPALDVLIAASKPHATCELDGFSDRESLFYPAHLPVTFTLELIGHPVLDAVRTALLPQLTAGQHLIAVHDKLEIIPSGGHMCPQRRLAANNDGKVATIILTLPVRFRGGALIVHDFDEVKEKFFGRGGKSGDIEWTAFLAECNHEVETVQKGCRVTFSYNVYVKTFAPPAPLFVPTDRFLDTISPILNLYRGRKIAFHLVEQYGFSPSDVIAESLVPHLKGGDALLYHALKLYKLSPALHWTAGPYMWPVDGVVDLGVESVNMSLASGRNPLASPRRAQFPTPIRVPTAYTHEPEDEDPDSFKYRVERSGAVRLVDAEVYLLTDKEALQGNITKERVPFVSTGALDRLIVNALVVAFIP